MPPEGRGHLLLSGVGSGVEQVGPDRVMEQVGLLRDDAEPVPQRREGHIAQVESTDANGSEVGS